MNRNKIAPNANLRADWLMEALRLRMNEIEKAEGLKRMDDVISNEITGKVQKQKSLGYLKQVWLFPHLSFPTLQDSGIEIFRHSTDRQTAYLLSYFMTVATFPFTRCVVEACGQLHRLQGSVKMEQLKRKVAAIYGERERTLRGVRYVMYLLNSLGIVSAPKKKGFYEAGKFNVHSKELSSFAVKALLCSLEKENGMGRAELETHPVFFAFDGQKIVAEALQDSSIMLSRESMNREILNWRKDSKVQ
jgi:hypothetical protein